MPWPAPRTRRSRRGGESSCFFPPVVPLFLFVVGFSFAVPACAHPGRLPPGPTATETASLPAGRFEAPPSSDLPPPDSIPGAFTVRQKLVAKSAHGGGSFEAVLAKAPGHLTIVGLMPYGARAFLLEQRGADVQFTNYMPRDPPFPPSWVLLDVYRVFGSWLGAPLDHGAREGVALGERVREQWQAGRLLERTFTRMGAAGTTPEARVIVVHYQGIVVPPGLAEHVHLRNDRFGYELTIHTLPASPALPPS